MNARQRQVLHVDMDAFYASVEQRDNPELRGKPLIVGGSSNRGVVAAASYEAREFGIRSAMPVREALRRCPTVCQVKPRMDHYRAASREVFEVFREFTPLVEGLSLDEAFLDVSGSLSLFGNARDIAARIKERIRERTALTASVGVAPNKLVAKIASDLDKPDGLVVVTPDTVQPTLDPLPVETIPGIGRQTLARLHRHRIRTIRDLRTAPDAELDAVFGRYAARMRERASGIDGRAVVSERSEKSVSAEATFSSDLDTLEAMQRELLRLAERTAGRLRQKDLFAGTVQLKVRAADFSTFTRQCSLRPPSNATSTLYANALALLQAWLRDNPGVKVRLLGVGGSDLAAAAQPDLFAAAEGSGGKSLDKAADAIRERFAGIRLGRARTFRDD